jgi:hypothetical protein
MWTAPSDLLCAVREPRARERMEAGYVHIIISVRHSELRQQRTHDQLEGRVSVRLTRWPYHRRQLPRPEHGRYTMGSLRCMASHEQSHHTSTSADPNRVQSRLLTPPVTWQRLERPRGPRVVARP